MNGWKAGVYFMLVGRFVLLAKVYINGFLALVCLRVISHERTLVSHGLPTAPEQPHGTVHPRTAAGKLF